MLLTPMLPSKFQTLHSMATAPLKAGPFFARGASVQVTVNSSYFYMNEAQFGGAIHVRENASLTLRNTHISTCRGHHNGGAIYLEENAALEMIGGSMAYNTGGRGGACSCHSSKCAFIDTIVGPGNRAIGRTTITPYTPYGGVCHSDLSHYRKKYTT